MNDKSIFKRLLSLGLIVILLYLFNVRSALGACSAYSSVPPFINANVPSNLMLVLDYSGSMSFFAYPGCTEYSSYSYFEDCGLHYDESKTYYGYFKPDKMYRCSKYGTIKIKVKIKVSKKKKKKKTLKFRVCKGYWYEDPNAPFNNSDDGVEKHFKGGQYQLYSINEDRAYSGNLLNWLILSRIDILKWILTGGKVETIKGKRYVSTFFRERIKPYKKGYYVTVKVENRIKIEDVTTYDPDKDNVIGILQKIEAEKQKPRIGAVFFSTTVFETLGLDYDYSNLIYVINSLLPGGATATHLAVEFALDLYRNDTSVINKFFFGVSPYVFDIDGKETTVPCAKNFVLLMSDGAWNTGDHFNACYTTWCDPIRPIDAMWKGGRADLVRGLKGNQNAETYTVSMFSDPSSFGTNALKWMAVYGNYNDVNADGYPCKQSNYPITSLTVKETLENNSTCNEVRENKDKTGPYGFFEAENPSKLRNAIEEIFNEILRRVSAGSATSVLAVSQESGSNMVRAVFYPKKYFENSNAVDWIGELYNLWFYLGPYAQNIREDTANSVCTGSKCLDLKEDNVLEFIMDNATNAVEAKICPDLNGDGIIDNFIDTSGNIVDESSKCKIVPLEDVSPIWEAGKVLWNTSPDDRIIFTGLDLDNNSTINKDDAFSTTYDKELENYLDVDNLTLADEVINYIRGEDFADTRSRSATIDSVTHVWKLGDIVYSTPKIVTYSALAPLNSYYKDYNDATYKQFLESLHYNNLSMVFVGANDGMLHAFRMGELSFPGGNVLVELKEPKDGYGSEAWAFIPKNILPYLKYYMSKDYCHIYYVDLAPYVFDASINGAPDETKKASSWRRILIGGLRLGGACGDKVPGAVTPPNDTGKVPPGIGRSSYFAIDVTDPENPKLLWEFTDNDLGFTTTGPVVIHIPYKNADGTADNSKNGYWYVAFASGPDNYDGSVHRPLYLYVLNLKDGDLLKKFQLSGAADTLLGDIDAFAGRMFGAQVDLGSNYSDNGFYFGYTYKDGVAWKGGVIRVATGDESAVDQWRASKLIDGIGPVTASVAHVEDPAHGTLWLFFGEGRYFTKDDDPDAVRHIYGIKDPCYQSGKLPTTCTTDVKFSDLTDVTNNPDASISNDGWYITLSGKTSSFNAERVITDPVVNPINGWVFFTTFKPTGDICGFGGDTYVWVTNYSNGGTASSLFGSIFLQTSTGSISKINLAKEFTNKTSSATSYGRKIAAPIKGAPPLSVGGTILVPPRPLEKVIHWRENFVK